MAPLWGLAGRGRNPNGRARPAPPRLHLAALTLLSAPALLAAGLAGCAPEAKLLRSDPSFTAGALSGGGIAVVGVVKKDEVEQVRAPLIAALLTELGRARPDVRVVDADRVAERLGLPAYRRLLNSYQARGQLDSTEVRGLAGAIGGEARFAILGRVTSDAVRNSERGLAPEDSSRYRFFNTLLVTGRDARVDLQVYDLSTRAVVYHAQYAGSAEDARPARYGLQGGGAATGGGGVTVGVAPRDAGAAGVPDSLAEQWGRYPDAPTLASALAEAFRAFAGGLPR